MLILLTSLRTVGWTLTGVQSGRVSIRTHAGTDRHIPLETELESDKMNFAKSNKHGPISSPLLRNKRKSKSIIPCELHSCKYNKYK